MRPVQKSDAVWLLEAYSDWHEIHGDHLPVSQHDVNKWVIRWMKTSNNETALVNDAGTSLITFRHEGSEAFVDNLVTHPDHRRQGHANALIDELTEYLLNEGADHATFKTLAGPIRERYGLRGNVTADDARRTLGRRNNPEGVE